MAVKKQRKLLRRAIPGMGIILLIFAVLYLLPDDRIVVSPETTFVTEPLDAEGYVDYLAAANDLMREGVTPENNAAVLYLRALGPAKIEPAVRNDFFRQLGIEPLPEEGDYFESRASYNERVLAEERIVERENAAAEEVASIEFELNSIPWRREDDPHIARWLDANEAALALLVAGTKRTHHFLPLVPKPQREYEHIRFTPGEAEHLNHQYMGMARALMMRAMLRSGSGEHKLAWDDCLATVRLARTTVSSPSILSVSLAILKCRMATTGMASVLHEGEFSREELLERRREFRETVFDVSVRDAHSRIERFSILDMIQAVARSSEDTHHHLLRGGVDWNDILRRVNQDFDKLAQNLDETASDSSKRDQPETPQAMATEGDRNVVWQSARYLFSRAARTKQTKVRFEDIYRYLTDPNETIYNSAHESNHTRQEIEAIFALSLYRAEHGTYPETLDALVPNFLDSIPVDFWEEPLRYAREGVGYHLYSIGENGVDDDGANESDGGAVGSDDVGYRVPKVLTIPRAADAP